MRILAFILAVLVFTLSCMPCMDAPYAPGKSKARFELSKAHPQDDHNDSDNCSPFCTCNCCAGFAFCIAHYHVENYFPPSSQKTTCHHPEKTSNIALPIWQPPQIG